MIVTKDRMARDLADETGYYLKDIKTLLSAMDKIVKGYFAEVTDEDEISVQLVEGIKCGCKIVEARERVNPRDRTPIIVPDTVKPFSKFSEDFRKYIQTQYDKKKAK
jgi:hypothetical protein